ncbi:hypothetical protein PS850_06239 [Pseudomonas fluorescens]|nr:hypothetical protein PS850_06239 [Pseudomonas fluorescens]
MNQIHCSRVIIGSVFSGEAAWLHVKVHCGLACKPLLSTP